MTSWAATMHADMRAVSALFASASFRPTRGSIGAFEKWKSATHATKTSSGLHAINTLQPDGCSPVSDWLSPRARAPSIARACIDSTPEAAITEKIGTKPGQLRTVIMGDFPSSIRGTRQS
jgi:hypothetical protein